MNCPFLINKRGKLVELNVFPSLSFQRTLQMLVKCVGLIAKGSKSVIVGA